MIIIGRENGQQFDKIKKVFWKLRGDNRVSYGMIRIRLQGMLAVALEAYWMEMWMYEGDATLLTENLNDFHWLLDRLHNSNKEHGSEINVSNLKIVMFHMEKEMKLTSCK